MYQYTYGEILADSPAAARLQERAVLDHAIRLLRIAEADRTDVDVVREALAFTARLWGAFIKDLAHSGNDLPEPVRAQLMSIGLWVIRETCRIERGESGSFAAMAEICGVVRDGLH